MGDQGVAPGVEVSPSMHSIKAVVFFRLLFQPLSNVPNSDCCDIFLASLISVVSFPLCVSELTKNNFHMWYYILVKFVNIFIE